METSPYKITPALHLTHSKNGGNPGLVLKMKNITCISIVLTKHVKYTFFYICLNLFYTVLKHLKVIYKGFFKSFIVLYADRICPEHHFVENRIENFPSV